MKERKIKQHKVSIWFKNPTPPKGYYNSLLYQRTITNKISKKSRKYIKDSQP